MGRTEARDADGETAKGWIVAAALVVVAMLLVVGILVSAAVAAGTVVGTFFPQYRTLMVVSPSPNGLLVVQVYSVNPGPTGDEYVVAEASPVGGGTPREILRLSPQQLVKAKWASANRLAFRWRSPTMVEIGGFPAAVSPQ